MRKISKVGVRELSSDDAAAGQDRVSEIRAKVQNLKKVSGSCPAEVREEFAKLSATKVSLPSCPQGFVEQVQIASPMLKLEERSLLEEIAGAQCRTLLDSHRDVELRVFADRFEAEGPIGRRKTQPGDSMEEDFNTLTALRGSLNKILTTNVPLERWIFRNGSFVLPESDLDFFYDLIVEKGCRSVDDETIGHGFRALETLEELRPLLPENESRHELERFLHGLNGLIYDKVGEYF